MTKKRNIVVVKSSGFKKKKVKVPRRKLRKRGGSCRVAEYDFVPTHTEQRRTGRSIRTAQRMARNPQQMQVVK
jgi:hypothetical protein